MPSPARWSGLRGDPRIVMVDDHTVDLPPAQNMLIVRNDDVPGMIAAVAARSATPAINIDDMDVGHSVDGAAAMQVLATDVPVGDEVVAGLRAVPGIVSVHTLATDWRDV